MKTFAMISTGSFTGIRTEIARGTQEEMEKLKLRCDTHNRGPVRVDREVVEFEA